MGNAATGHRFGTVINCIDGRVQEPVAQWLKNTYQVDYVDTVTEPGADRVLAQGSPEMLAAIQSKVQVSIQAHQSDLVAIAGHAGCAGNPVSPEQHRQHIRQAQQVIRFWNLPVTVVGLWVNDQWQVEVVT